MYTRLVSGLLAAALLGACADSAGPVPPQLAARETVELRTLHTPHFLVQAATAPPLEALQASMWIVRGERQTLEVKYTNPTEDPAAVLGFLKLEFHDSTLVARPDGTPIATGDSVLVTVSIDPRLFVVRLEPTGLRFNPLEPARLRVRYHNADPDLNGDGSVDAGDDAIGRRLGLFRRDETDAFWVQLRAKNDTLEQKFDADLEHFSDYAVAW